MGTSVQIGPRSRRSIVIGTAGHIDHGKTALVQALTGVDTDRLPEEKRRGITIDLGFASLDLRLPDGHSVRLSLIDVPGHAKFVRNMLAGAGGIDAVLLVVSAEEGVKPQTEEHLAICGLLGIERGLTVLTEADAVNEEQLQLVSASVRRFLRGTFLESAPILSASARSGRGMEQVREVLAALAAGVAARKHDTPVRLPVDRVFTMKGFGTVATGTLMGGVIRPGDELAVQPGQLTVKVRGMQVHGQQQEIAFAGSRVALNLAKVETHELSRGDILVAPPSSPAVEVVDVELTMLPGVRPLKHRSKVHFHIFASECLASSTLFNAALIEPGESGLARFRLHRSIVLLPGDRFVLRQGTPLTTIGGGRILDAQPLLRIRKWRVADWLRQLRSGSFDERTLLRVERRGFSGISRKELAMELGASDDDFMKAIARLKGAERLHALASGRLISADAMNVVSSEISREFDKRIRATPTGVKRSELRGQLRLSQEIFDELISKMEVAGKLRVAGDYLLAAGATPVSQRDAVALAKITAEFECAGISPPTPNELAERLKISSEEMRRLVTILLRNGTLMRLGSDSLCMDRGALDNLAGKVRALRGQTLDVGEFKQLAGVSRKYAIPLLEFLDRQRITVKQGDRRLIL